MSLYSTHLPSGAQFDDNATWEPDYVERSIHEVESFVPNREPQVIPETDKSRAWKQRLANSLKKEAE